MQYDLAIPACLQSIYLAPINSSSPPWPSSDLSWSQFFVSIFVLHKYTICNYFLSFDNIWWIHRFCHGEDTKYNRSGGCDLLDGSGQRNGEPHHHQEFHHHFGRHSHEDLSALHLSGDGDLLRHPDGSWGPSFPVHGGCWEIYGGYNGRDLRDLRIFLADCRNLSGHNPACNYSFCLIGSRGRIGFGPVVNVSLVFADRSFGNLHVADLHLLVRHRRHLEQILEEDSQLFRKETCTYPCPRYNNSLMWIYFKISFLI